jgi:hypothetical protein
MPRSATEISFDALNRRETADRNGLRPVVVTHRASALKSLFHALAMRQLKIFRIGKSAHAVMETPNLFDKGCVFNDIDQRSSVYDASEQNNAVNVAIQLSVPFSLSNQLIRLSNASFIYCANHTMLRLVSSLPS